MSRPLTVGDVIHGFAGGAFGRDHYDCVRIEAVGPDWIVARDPDEPERWPSFAVGRQELELCQKARGEGHRAAMRQAGGVGDEPCPIADAGPPLTTYGLPS